MPKAFVIMPFSSDFNEIYNLFIASTLNDVGYEVFRADDIVSQRNILDDIIESINDSDLIVADLTGSNANVYYELGIVHAFRKPVILLTQSISDLPFDLRSYRAVHYNTHFAAIGDSKNKLKEFALAAKDGKLIFRSPVTDFNPVKSIDIPKSSGLTTVAADDNLGFLDHVLLMQNGFSAMSAVISEINERMRENTTKTQYVSDELNGTLASNDPNRLQKIQSLLGEFAVFQQKYAEFLKESNDKYEGNLDQTFTSLEFVITFQTPTTDEERIILTDLLSNLTLLENNSQLSLNSYAALVNSIQSTPKMEKTLNMAMEQVVIQINRFIGYTQQVVAMASRSIATIEKLLGS